MGESKRRKRLDPNYGKAEYPPITVEISEITGKKLIIVNGPRQKRCVSPHAKTETLMLGLEQCRLCMRTFEAQEWERDFEGTFSKFLRRITLDFPYPDEDEILGVWRNGEVDRSRAKRNEAMADANIAFIQDTGEKLFDGILTEFED